MKKSSQLVDTGKTYISMWASCIIFVKAIIFENLFLRAVVQFFFLTKLINLSNVEEIEETKKEV